jgi:hypothetical protein
MNGNKEALLGLIWNGVLKQNSEAEPTQLFSVMKTLFDVEVIALVSTDDVLDPVAYPETLELMEGVALGDVLAQEFSIEVPPGAIILIEPDRTYDEKFTDSKQLGQVLGSILAGLIESLEEDAHSVLVQDALISSQPKFHRSGFHNAILAETSERRHKSIFQQAY